MGCEFIAADWTRQKLCPLGRLYRHSIEERKFIINVSSALLGVGPHNSKKSGVLSLSSLQTLL